MFTYCLLMYLVFDYFLIITYKLGFLLLSLSSSFLVSYLPSLSFDYSNNYIWVHTVINTIHVKLVLTV